MLARSGRLTPEAAVKPMERTTRFIRRTMTSAQADVLLRRCRENGVTVHGALSAAMAMAIGPAAAQRTSGRMCIGSPMICARTYVLAFRRTRWELRQHGAVPGSIRRQVRLVVDRASGQPVASPIQAVETYLTLLWGLRFLCPVSVAKSSRAFSFIERNGPLNVGISDLGCFDFPAEVGGWQLSGAQFISGVSISGYGSPRSTPATTNCFGTSPT